jgi:hypothetical protein
MIIWVIWIMVKKKLYVTNGFHSNLLMKKAEINVNAPVNPVKRIWKKNLWFSTLVLII